jgi:hypothetical protein
MQSVTQNKLEQIFDQQSPIRIGDVVNYCSITVYRNKETGIYSLQHDIEVLAATNENYTIFVHLICDDLDPSSRFTAKYARTPDTRFWQNGNRITLHHDFRLASGDYAIYVGFSSGSMRLPIANTEEDRAYIGKLKISTSTPVLLDKTAPLREVGTQKFLDAILKLPAVFVDEIGPLEHLIMCYAQAPQAGAVMEFGVAYGTTIRAIANAFPHRVVWGFDSFEGLPEDWVRNSTEIVPAGTFAQETLPPVPPNAHLVKGWFKDTLPKWMDEQKENVAFLHIDVDIYSSTKYVLTSLNDRIVPGTVIVFDDLGTWDEILRGNNLYNNWQQEEWRGMIEWMEEFGRELAPTSRGINHILGVRVIR